MDTTRRHPGFARGPRLCVWRQPASPEFAGATEPVSDRASSQWLLSLHGVFITVFPDASLVSIKRHLERRKNLQGGGVRDPARQSIFRNVHPKRARARGHWSLLQATVVMCGARHGKKPLAEDRPAAEQSNRRVAEADQRQRCGILTLKRG